MEEIKLNITLSGFTTKDIKPGSVLLIRYGSELSNLERAKVVKALREKLDDAGVPKEVMIFLARPGDSIEAFDEATMNRAGWFRTTLEPPMLDLGSAYEPLTLVELDVSPDHKVAWVNVNGRCALRCSNIETLQILDRAK